MTVGPASVLAQVTATFTKTPTPTFFIPATFTPVITATRTPTKTFTPLPILSPSPSPTAVVMVALGPAEPPDSTQTAGAVNVPAIQIELTNMSHGPVTLTSLKLTAQGTGDDAAGVSFVGLYLDANRNGLLDAGDSLLSIGIYNSDNGIVTFEGSDVLPALGVQDYLAAYDFSPTAGPGTYQPTIAANGDLTGVDSNGVPAVFVGAPVTGAVITIGAPLPTPTSTATFSATPTPPGPVTLTYVNTEGACSAAFGCSLTVVEACRQLNLDPTTSYMMMRICALCGVCQPSDIMTLRLTMGWDEICANYGIDWSTFVADLETRLQPLAPEIVTPNQIIRAAANDPAQFPISNPDPGMPDLLVQNSPVSEVCPLCQ